MRQSVLTAILGTILLGAAAGQAHAQYRDRDYGYGDGRYGNPGGNGRGDYVVNRVMRDVERMGRGSGWGGIFGGGPKKDRESLSGTSSSAASPQNDSRSLNQPAPPPATQQALAAQAREHYQRAMQAQRDGNWALYGEEIRLLGESLQGMSK